MVDRVLVALVPGILVASDFGLWLLPLIGVPLVAIQLGSRQSVINEHAARHDRVTGLSNREDVARLLEHALHRAERHGAQVGVLMVGLSRFKEINETLGHRRGDLVLIEVARRLAAVARPSDVAARLGGDEFALIVTPVDGPGLPERRGRGARGPARSRSTSAASSSNRRHAGIACHPEHGDSFDALLRHADVALDRPRSRTATGWSTSPTSTSTACSGSTLVGELRRAIDAGELRAVLPAAGRARGGGCAPSRRWCAGPPRARPARAGGVHRARRAHGR